MNVKCVGRIRGRLIFKAECKTIEDVQGVDPKGLSNLTGLPEQTCERIVSSTKDYSPVEDEERG
ncbi:MAG TPA: hypothetical protein VKM55_06260 [Candidatus Lokiarchaeia archaeon]|nr:hypothetical protein [Candidatus Lokiarchaeia archaeon]